MTEPSDPDPFHGVDLAVPKPKSRRSSLAPPSPYVDHSHVHEAGFKHLAVFSRHLVAQTSRSDVPAQLSIPSSSVALQFPSHADLKNRSAEQSKLGRLPDSILVLIFDHLSIGKLMRMREVCTHWHQLVVAHPDLMHSLDLSHNNRNITDAVITKAIAPFVGARPRHVNINNCFHISDIGFAALVEACAQSVRSWKMRSVWDVSGPCILGLVAKSPLLEELDLSNCRKVGDNLLARIVGWVVPQQSSHGPAATGLGIKTDGRLPKPIVVGSPKLKRLTLSYCKHVQDRSMAHIAQNAAARLEMMDLSRCTSVTDQGFRHWSSHSFPMLTKLVLADCTYLSDQSIVSIANAARNLRELDLSFCCALSDTATEVLSLGLSRLTHLDLAFCGSAVSESSLRSIGLHLLELKFLSVRGCIRVTGQAVESVLDGCHGLDVFDISQCKNLCPWIAAGGIEVARGRGCRTRFDLVADGTWRSML